MPLWRLRDFLATLPGYGLSRTLQEELAQY